jgi:hypothetical protein
VTRGLIVTLAALGVVGLVLADTQMITSAAGSIPGLDVSRLLAGINSDAVEAQAGAFDKEAAADNVQATPTILVGKSGGALRPVTLTSPSDGQLVASAIDSALR